MVGIVQAVVDVGGTVLVYTTGASWPILPVFVAWAWSIVWGVRTFLASGNDGTPTAGAAAATAPTKGKAKTRA